MHAGCRLPVFRCICTKLKRKRNAQENEEAGGELMNKTQTQKRYSFIFVYFVFFSFSSNT